MPYPCNVGNGEQIGDPAVPGQHVVGIEFRPRHEDESPYGGSRVRHDEVRFVEAYGSHREHVDVEGTGAVLDRPDPVSSLFEALPEPQKVPRVQVGLTDEHGIEESGLIDVPDRIGLVDPGDPEILEAAGSETVHCPLKVAEPVPDVRTDAVGNDHDRARVTVTETSTASVSRAARGL